MATFGEFTGSKTSSSPNDNNKVGTFESVLAGIGSGLIGIPKGLFSLGATLMDLGVDSGRAAKVEQWFDDLTSWDEKAEATTAGKLTEILVNIGVPGGLAFRHGTKIAGAAMRASKSGNYLDLNNPILKKGMKDTFKLTARGKGRQFMTGALLGGAAEGVFIGDVQDVGSLGDLLGGPTEIDRGEGEDAFRDLLNRVKFGTEGALFTGLIGGTGATIRKLRNRNNELDIANSQIDRWIDKVGGYFRSRSGWTPEAFAEFRLSKGLAGGDARVAKTISRDIDKSIDAIFPRMKTMMDNSPTSKARTEFMADVNDALLSGTSTLDEAGKVTWSKMDPDILAKVVRQMDSLGAKPDDIAQLTGGLSVIRTKWGNLFTELGKTLSKTEIDEFRTLFGNKFKNYLGSTYEFMYNKSLIPWFRYKPARQLIDRAKQVFIDSAEAAGRKPTPQEAETMVSNVLKSAGMPKGFRLDKPSDALFNIPEFFLNKTSLDSAVTQRGTQRISIGSIAKDVDRKVFEDLLGKHKNPMQTILGGTAKLSMIVRRNVFFKNLMKKNDELMRAGKMPMFVRSEDEALKWFGDNYKRIEVIDPAQTLHVGTAARGSAIKKAKDAVKSPTPATGSTNPFSDPVNPWFATPGMADALKKTGMEVADKGMIGQLYHSLLLYPKATSQVAKTILSPVTHMRNFISAGAFAAANGIVPFADKAAIKQAYQALQTPLKGTRMQNELYDGLLELGVVNTNVRLGDVSRLLEDVKFGETMTANKGTAMLLKPLQKFKSAAQDMYTAEDDFWKIYSWAVEKKRMETAMTKIGLTKNLNQTFKNAAGETINLTDDWLEREAADIVKNNIPNYDYVPDFIKGLRKLPVGNFVSFPAEIARTGANIVQRALREINTTFTLANGKVIKPFQGIGYTRLFGFTTTVAAIPYATQKMFQVIYDVTDDEREAIRRYVAKWSKNSTILPMKDENGDFKYIDFSHANAYDTLVRPLQAVVNAVADGQSEDGIMDDFMKGMFDSMKEFGEPFISESIWTEAAFDVLLRGGRSREGYEVYNKEDSAGNKASKIFKHLVKTQMPGSIDQFERLDRAFKPINFVVKGKYDEYGQEYEFGDEFAGLFGFRAVKLNPERTIKFKVADYKKGVRDSGSLFTRETLKGGPIEPREIVEAYINANRALFNVKKNFMQDLNAAQILGISDEAYRANVDISSRERSAIEQGIFRPYTPSVNIRQAFAENAAKIGMANPYESAADTIGSISEQLSGLSLNAAEFPTINNPLMPSIMDQRMLPNINTGTPLNLPSVSANVVGAQTGNIPYNQMTSQQKLNILFGKG